MKRAIAALTVCVLALSLAACGGKSDKGSAGLDAIKEKGKLVMLTNATFPPFEYIGADGQPAGVDVDVAKEVAKDLGVELEIVDMNFDLLIESLKAGKGDFVAAGMTIKPDRQEQVDFSKEYVKSAQHVIIKAGSGVTAGALDGKTVAVQESTTGDFYATDEIQAKEVLRFKGATETGAALKAGKCDAIILDRLPAEAIVANAGGELELLPDPLTEESYAFAVAKGNAALLEAINGTMQRLMDAGTIDELVTTHADAS